MTERQRRVYLINPPFQLKYILLLMACGGVLAVAFGLWNHQVQQHAVEAAVSDPAHRDAIVRGGRLMIWAMGGVCALAVLALGAVGFLMTHRIAGPLFVMSYFLELLAEGRFPPPRALRRHDELKAFHAQFLKSVEAMKEREARHLQRIQEALVAMRQVSPRAPELLEVIRALELDAGERRQALAEASPPAVEQPVRAAG